MPATPPPVEVGARGTIASLVLQEIEHFRNLEIDRPEKPNTPTSGVASTSGGCKKKKKNKKAAAATGGGFLPSICSAVEITDSRRATIGYKNLRADGKMPPTED